MNPAIQKHYAILGSTMVHTLEKLGYKARFFQTREEAIQYLMDTIPYHADVGIGGSATLIALGIEEELERRGNKIINHNRPALSKEEVLRLRREELACHSFLTSTNALTLKGEFVNTDGAGNRVGAMAFGPKESYIVLGMNKIVPHLDAAMERVHMVAAPTNNARFNTQNPCMSTGHCVDCNAPTRICNITTILHRKPSAIDIHVVLIGEDLGF